MVHVSRHPLVRTKLTRLRDERTPPKKFSELVRELTTLLAYEATQDLDLEPTVVKTPMSMAPGCSLKDRIGLVPILRAGLGMVEPMRELMPQATVYHIGIYRNEETHKPVEYYNKLPELEQDEILLILDPMLATGGSAVDTCDMLKRRGAKRIKFIGLIAAPEGVANLRKNHPDVPIHLGAIDECLNEHKYIIPGLGDAGRRQYGTG